MNKKDIKNLNITVLVFAVLMLFASFLPVSRYGIYYEDISYLKGFTYLLYLTPFFIIGPAVASLYNKIFNQGVWYASVGIIGLVLTIFTDISGNNALNSFIRLNFNTNHITPRLGIGTILLFVGYTAISLIGYAMLSQGREKKEHKRERHNENKIENNSGDKDDDYPLVDGDVLDINVEHFDFGRGVHSESRKE